MITAANDTPASPIMSSPTPASSASGDFPAAQPKCKGVLLAPLQHPSAPASPTTATAGKTLRQSLSCSVFSNSGESVFSTAPPQQQASSAYYASGPQSLGGSLHRNGFGSLRGASFGSFTHGGGSADSPCSAASPRTPLGAPPSVPLSPLLAFSRGHVVDDHRTTVAQWAPLSGPLSPNSPGCKNRSP